MRATPPLPPQYESAPPPRSAHSNRAGRTAAAQGRTETSTSASRATRHRSTSRPPASAIRSTISAIGSTEDNGPPRTSPGTSKIDPTPPPNPSPPPANCGNPASHPPPPKNCKPAAHPLSAPHSHTTSLNNFLAYQTGTLLRLRCNWIAGDYLVIVAAGGASGGADHKVLGRKILLASEQTM